MTPLHQPLTLTKHFGSSYNIQELSSQPIISCILSSLNHRRAPKEYIIYIPIFTIRLYIAANPNRPAQIHFPSTTSSIYIGIYIQVVCVYLSYMYRRRHYTTHTHVTTIKLSSSASNTKVPRRASSRN